MPTLVRCLSIAILASAGCDCSADHGSSAGMDGGRAFPDGTIVEDGRVILPDGRIITSDAARGDGPATGDEDAAGIDAPRSTTDGGGLDGGDGPCVPASCQGHTYECGDCLDNDGDGRADSRDLDCLGPCFNDESVYYPGIPGGDTPTCLRDCYYDQDQGPGNDGCAWDSRCDPLSPDPNPRCAFRTPRPRDAMCPDPQEDACHDFCGPLTPNGCDCFGCCTFDAIAGRAPAMGGEHVFVGTRDAEGEPTCSLDDVRDTTLCRPCTPVLDCLNTCERCELCVGRTEIPADCFPPPPRDAGPPRDAAVPDSATPPTDSGPPPPMRCPAGVQACGLPGDPPCADGWYCLTGCCVFFG